MPEGDTIFRTAARLRTVLEARAINSARCRDPHWPSATLTGRTVSSVEARGKHLLMRLDDGRVIHSHMGMTGSWHVYRIGERWWKPEQRAALELHTAEAVIVCFSPKTLELLSSDALRRHPLLRRLGPDLLSPTMDAAEVLRRFRVHNAAPIGEAVMNQSIVCGIGNVYKSETLFLTRLNPFTPVAALPDDQIRSMVNRARQLMAGNLQTYPRRTRLGRDGQRLWVYGRSGQPCFECGTRIQLRRQGDLGRSTYWCPACQSSVND